jgi:hypothetical protein
MSRTHIRGRVIQRDKGLKRIMFDIKALNKSHTKIGVQMGDANKEGLYLAQIGAWNEWGTPTIPERPHHRLTFTENLKKAQNLGAKVYKSVQLGTRSPEHALGIIGEWYLNALKHNIVALKNPPNAPSTIKKKKSSNPLIDTSEYLNSMQHVEVMK